MENKQTHQQKGSYIAICLLLGFMLVTTAHGKPNEKVSQLQVKENTEEREVLENREQHVKLIKNKDSNGQVTALIGLDYAERLVAIYVPEQNACFLIGGIMKEVGTFDDDQEIMVTLTPKVPNMETGRVLLKYSVNDIHPVTNTAILTKILSSNLNCNGSNTYWAERNEALNIGDGTTTKATTSPVTAMSLSRKKRSFLDSVREFADLVKRAVDIVIDISEWLYYTFGK